MNKNIFMSAASVLLLTTAVFSGQLVLVEDGKCDYHIVVALDASIQDYHAAEVLQRYLREMTDAELNELRIVSDDNALGDREIIIGFNRHVELIDPKLKQDSFGPEAFRIKTYGKHLVIVGGSPRGVLYGVNSLLTDEFGCRWFTPLLRQIPKNKRLVLGPVDRRYEPHFEWRDAFFASASDNEWAFRNFLNKFRSHLRPEQGGRAGFAWRQHTALALVPPDRYQKDHPEYYWTGKGNQPRNFREGLGICLTHPDVAVAAVQTLLEHRRKHPQGDLHYALSSMDRPDWCECPRCRAWHQRFREKYLESGRVDPRKVDTYPLSNEWFFAPDPDDDGQARQWYADGFDDSGWSAIRSDLGSGWERQYEGDYGSGLGWYRQRWRVPVEAASRKHLYLFFGAVDEEAWVYINGQEAFEHSRASTGLSPSDLWMAPFSFDAGRFIRPGEENTIAVRVFNISGMGGVYKPVYLLTSDEPLNATHMRQVLNVPVEGYEWRHGALWLDFAGRVQALIADEPNPPKLAMLAYGYTADPPVEPVMHDGLTLFYAETMISQFHALDDPKNSSNTLFRRRLETWRQCGTSTYLWHYHMDFNFWDFVHPNMHTFAEDLRYLRDVGVTGIFGQGNQMEISVLRFDGEMNELRAYLLARLLWNPDLDWRQERREFCAAYYGAEAGRVIEQYLDDMRGEFVKHDVECFAIIPDPRTFAWITPEIFARWHAYMDKAESLAADAEHKKLVQIARLSITFTEASCQKDPQRRKQMQQAYWDTGRSLGALAHIGESKPYALWARKMGLKN